MSCCVLLCFVIGFFVYIFFHESCCLILSLYDLFHPLWTAGYFQQFRRRRASAARILQSKKNFSKLQLVKYGFRTRVARNGFFGGLVETVGVGIQEVCSFILTWTLRLVVFYPFVFTSRFIKLVTKLLTGAFSKTKQQQPDATQSS